MTGPPRPVDPPTPARSTSGVPAAPGAGPGAPGRYLGAAFVSPLNLAMLLLATALALAGGTVAPLAVALGLEATYLALVPGTAWFQRRAGRQAWRRRLAVQEAEDRRLLLRLAPSQRARVESMYRQRAQVAEAYARLGPGVSGLGRQSLGKIDRLVSSFVRLLDHLNAYRRILDPGARERLERERAALERETREETRPHLREIKARRLDILGRRLERFEKASDHREILSHQLAAVEDLLSLVHEQALTLRGPEDVSRQLDTLTAELAETEDTVREMDRILALHEALEAERADTAANLR